MTEWANYDIEGKRVPSDSKRAVFRAKEVSVDTGVPAPLVMRADAVGLTNGPKPFAGEHDTPRSSHAMKAPCSAVESSCARGESVSTH